MQEFWATVSRHHSSLRFKLNGKIHMVNVDNFKDMLLICPKLTSQNFEDPPFEEEILSFIRELGLTGEIKFLSDANVNHMHQPWRSFAAIINKCLSGKTTTRKVFACHILKPKYAKNKVDPESYPKKKSAQAPEAKRLKTSAKVTKPAKKKQPAKASKAKSLHVLSEATLSEAEQMKLDTKRSKIQFYSSYACGSDNDSDDFVHPKLSTHNEEERCDNEETMEDIFDPRVQTPSHVESTDVEDYDEVTQGENDEDEEVNELYRDVNINLEGRETEMTDTPKTNLQATQITEDTHVILTIITLEAQQQSSSVSSGFISNMLNPNPDTGIEFILNLNTKSTSLVDVPVTTNVEIPPSSATTLPPPPIPLIQPQQQTSVPILVIVLSTSLQNLPTFGSLFKIGDRVKNLEDDLSKFKQPNPFAEALSLILGIVDMYLANKINEAIKIVVQLQSDRLRDEAQAKNEDFINKLDENIKKIIKEQVKDEDDDEEPSVGSNRGSKRRRAGKEPESTSEPKEKTSKSTGKSSEWSKSHQKSTGKSTQVEGPIHTADELEEPQPLEFKVLLKINLNLARKDDSRDSFNKLMDTHLDFSAFVMNRLKVDTLTLELLVGLTFELMKGLCHRVIPFDHFINNDVAYLRGGASSRTYATSVTKTKAADYGHIKWIEDLVPNTMWSQNKDKKNKLMRIDDLHKFSDGTLNDVQTALDDILKRIGIKYLPQTFWRNLDKEKAGAMIQVIDKQLKNRRIMRSLKKFVGGRPYKGDVWLLEMTI
nr:hypothetical protein [Tanacetum cinerariifolium]